MKHLGSKALVIAICCVFPALKSQAQENVIKTNPLPIIMGQIPFTAEYRLVYERAITDEHAVWIGAAYIGHSPVLDINDLLRDPSMQAPIAVNGVRAQAGYKYYIEGAGNGAPDGLYVGPYLSYNKTRFINKQDRGEFLDVQFASICGIFGYQVIVSEVVAIDFFTGAGYKHNSLKYHSPQGTFNSNDIGAGSGVKLLLGLNMGVAF